MELTSAKRVRGTVSLAIGGFLVLGAVPLGIHPSTLFGAGDRPESLSPCDRLIMQLRDTADSSAAAAVASEYGLPANANIPDDVSKAHGAVLCFDQYSEESPTEGSIDAVAFADPRSARAWLVLAEGADSATDWTALIREHGYEPTTPENSIGTNFWSAVASTLG